MPARDGFFDWNQTGAFIFKTKGKGFDLKMFPLDGAEARITGDIFCRSLQWAAHVLQNQLFHRHRAAKPVTLVGVAAIGEQAVALGFGFYAFGNHAQA